MKDEIKTKVSGIQYTVYSIQPTSLQPRKGNFYFINAYKII